MTAWNVPALLDDFAPPLVITPAQVDRLVEAAWGSSRRVFEPWAS